MIPLGVFLLACAGVYLGAIDAAFGALMRLSLRLVAERTNRPGSLDVYLDDPLLLFIPIRLLLGLVTGAATAMLTREIGVDGAHTVLFIVVAIVTFVALVELVNYEWIKKTRGAEGAEEALLRAVIKLRRLVRDVDTTGRVQKFQQKLQKSAAARQKADEKKA